jgi:hypothetical protein
LLIGLLAVVAIEAGLRALALVPVSSHAFVPDRELGYRLAPGVFGLETGFREDAGGPGAPGNPKLLFVGDSFTFGTYPAPHDVPGQVRAHLADRGVEATVLNRGLTGAGSDTYVRLARTFVADENPDAIVVMVYLGNDIHQSHPRQETRLLLGRLVVVNRTFAVGPHTREFHIRNALVLLRERVLTGMAGRSRPLAPQAGEAERINGPMEDGQLRRTYRAELRASARTPSGFMREAEAGLVERLAQIRAIAGDRPVLVVLAPSRIHADGRFADELLVSLQFDPDDYCLGCMPERIAEAVRAAGLPVLDLMAGFAAVLAEQDLYNRADIHWNRAGNALAGREIAAWIAANPRWLRKTVRP